MKTSQPKTLTAGQLCVCVSEIETPTQLKQNKSNLFGIQENVSFSDTNQS